MTISPSAENYLEAIFSLEEAKSPVSTSALAERLGVTAASATQMMQNFAEQGLADYSHYRGIALTPEGREKALASLRRHRLWEGFLYEHLKLDWAELHEEACRLEHATSEVVEQRLAQVLGEPVTCPHGHPVPRANGTTQEVSGVSLGSLEPGKKGVVFQVPEGQKELMQHLEEIKLMPGSTVEVLERSPMGGPLLVKIEGRVHPLDGKLAEGIILQPVQEGEVED